MAIVQTYTDLCVPWGVAVSLETGCILVAETGGNCVTSIVADRERKGFLGGVCGSDPGEFCGPRGIAIDPKDRSVLVVDSANNRLQKFNENCDCISSVGEEGCGPLQFMIPVGVGINSQGMIYVCDRDNNRIQILNTDLTYYRSFGSHGNSNGYFSSPLDVSFDEKDNVYIADSGNHCVQIFSKDGRFQRKVGRKGCGDGELYYPSAVSVNSSGVMYVLEGSGRVCLFSCETGQFLQSFGSLRYPCGLTVDQDARVYVSDSGNNRLVVFSTQGH